MLKEEYEKYTQMNERELNQEFVVLCKKGDLETIRYLLTHKELNKLININLFGGAPLKGACSNGHLDVVQYLLFSPEINTHADVHEGNNCAFLAASEYGHIEIVKYLIEQFDFNEANIKNQHYIFKVACYRGESEVAKLLWSSLEKNNHKNTTDFIKLKKDILNNACSKGYVEIMKLMLNISSNDMNDLTIKNINEAFHHACFEKQKELIKEILFSDDVILKPEADSIFTQSKIQNISSEILSYLIIDCNIEYTQKIHKLCSKHHEVKSLFAKRDLEKKLNMDLNTNITINKKNKL